MNKKKWKYTENWPENIPGFTNFGVNLTQFLLKSDISGARVSDWYKILPDSQYTGTT